MQLLERVITMRGNEILIKLFSSFFFLLLLLLLVFIRFHLPMSRVEIAFLALECLAA